MKIIAGLLLGGLSWTAFAAPGRDLPPLVLSEGVGVNIHFTRGHEHDLDLIAAAGFKFIRMDFGWSGIERKRGEYDWSAYDELTANLEQRHLRAVYIFDYSNGLYEDAVEVTKDGKKHRDTAAPQHPESVAAFARWAAAAAKHFQGRSIIWEIWNEPNIQFWKPEPDVKQYIALVQATTRAVRAAQPEATIVAPGSSTFPWAFLEELLAAPGVLDGLDGISVHPYRNYSQGPETAAADFLRLRGLIERYAPPAKKSMPILSSEWGYATHTKGVSLETQAAFLARQQLANVLQGVPLSIWYDWKNDGLDPAYNENNFGTVSNSLAPKPSYLAAQTLTRELAGCHIARRLDTARADDYALLLVNAAGDQKIAAWTTGQPNALSLDLGLESPSSAAVVTGSGQPGQINVQQGKLVLDLQAAPQFVSLKKSSSALTAAAAWNVDGFVPTLVEAGGTEAAKIPVLVRNPFDHAIQVKLALESPAGIERRSVSLEPGRSAREEFKYQPRLHTGDAISVMLRAEFQEQSADGSWRALGQSGEEHRFLVANPLALSLAPVERGVQLRVRNPSGAAFAGTAVISGAKFPVRLERGMPEFTVNAPGSPDSLSVQLLGADGQAATDPLARRFRRLAVPGLKAVIDGDANASAHARLAETNAPASETAPFAQACRLDYSLEGGPRFLRCAPAGKKTVVLEGPPSAVGLWVYGDNSGSSLRMRANDTGGQFFQIVGPSLNWTGWRWVEFDLANLAKALHWGGANDGTVHGALWLDTLLLVDAGPKKTSGTLYFAGAAVVLPAAVK